jgi:hypothetical protein
MSRQLDGIEHIRISRIPRGPGVSLSAAYDCQ